MIEFHLDGRYGDAPYMQLIQQVRQAMRLGLVCDGDQLPTVKDVWRRWRSTRTRWSYRELEYEGLVAARPGGGHVRRPDLDRRVAARARSTPRGADAMIWFTWRQFRTQTWTTVGGLAVLGVLLIITARSIADAYDAANVAGCGSDCTNAIENFLRDAKAGTNGTVYNLATWTMHLVPVLIGMFWGAPLIARELETGTHRLAWNQTVTRTRWLATKLAIIGSAMVASVGLLSWAITTWAHRIDDATGDRIKPLFLDNLYLAGGVYGARGIVPIGYALFAFIVGVTAGMLIRRTVPAMAATLGVYVAIVLAMPIWIREHLTPATHVTRALDIHNLTGLAINADNSLDVFGQAPSNAWVLSNDVSTTTGEVFTGPADPQYCAPAVTTGQSCEQWLGTLGLRQDLTYHPNSHFWSLQWAEAGILIGLAVLLAGFCFWWIRRRVA